MAFAPRIHALFLGFGAALWLAGCGGQEHDMAAQAEKASVRIAVPPIAIGPRASEPATVKAEAGAVQSEDEAIPLKQQIALLRREVADIRQRLERMPAAALDPEVAPKPPIDPVARLEAERVEQQRIAATESAFRSEREDSRWSQDTVASVRAAVAETDESFRNQVRSVECRSQSCRLVIGGDISGPGQQDFFSMMNRLSATFLNVTAGQIEQGDGRSATVLYLSH